jgi:ketosteroid isomerase-like protein
MNKTTLIQKTLFALFFCFSVFANAQEDVQKLADKWTEAYNAFDEKALGDLYTENAHLYVHGSPMYIGRDVIREFWKDDFVVENPKTILTVTHSVDGYDMILVHGNYQVVDRSSGDVLGHGRFAHIWHDVDGEWKLDQDLWNQPFEEE